MATDADPPAILTRAALPVSRTAAYGPDPAQVYDVRSPTRAPGGTTVVVIHGGFWRAEFDRSHAASQAQAFADNGFHVAVLEYRRVGMTGGGWPGTFQDVAAAVAAVRADPELPDRVVLVGHSAGGHLAALVASQPAALGLRGVVCLAGCVDLALTARMGLGAGAAQTLMGGEPEDLPDAYAEADPCALTPAVPVVLLHGADDQVVPPAVSRSYWDRMQRSTRAHAEVRHTVIPACEHFGLIDPGHPAFADVLDSVRSLAP
ncbi:MAG: alpha/beta hydrolase [Dermatophilaceae bacterium]